MKTLDELKEFYDSTLLADLKGLEEKRKGVMHKVMIVGGGILCVLVVGFIVFAGGGGGNPVVIFIPLVGCVIVGGIIVAIISKGYVAEFKAKIIRIAAEQLSIPEEDASNVLRPKKEVVRNFEHNLCLAILGAAKSAGKLVV